ncbi:response regulator transcription factor [Metasolibacillus meyeri]|uniref:response regulator transcription factor n=1 Tax=Metasolibacillus meyeri TaxID=1071052 RepID=UPI000D31603A|nr:response regulator transcription factor [Metasolibacillus meyeri]
MIKVLIVDDHPIVLEGSKRLMESADDIQIDTELQAMNVKSRLAANDYDVYLLDVNLGEDDGISLAQQIKEQTNARVILYTGDDPTNYYSLIVEKKVDGVVSKMATRFQVIQTIRAAIQGLILIPTDFLDYIHFNSRNDIELTAKEKMLVSWLQEGLTNKEMAAKLHISVRTIERYWTQLFQVLGATSRESVLEIVKEQRLLE